MNTVLLAFQTLVFIVCLLSNALHLIIVSNFMTRFQPADIARILPSGFLIMITIAMVTIEVYTVNNKQDNNTYMYDLIADKLEFLQISTVLGLNFLAAITKLRSYTCKVPAAISITRTSVFIPAFFVLASSIMVTSTLCLYRPLVQNRTESDTTDYIELSAELFIYHTFEIIPTMAVYITILVYAYQYYKQSSEKVKSFGIKTDRTSQRKQFRSVTISVLLYIMTFLVSWIPYLTITIIAIYSDQPPQQLAFKKVKLCLKMAMFGAYPVADGMLLKRSRKKIRLVLLKIAQFFSSMSRAMTNCFTSSLIFYILQTLTPKHHLVLQCDNVNENCEFIYTGETSDVRNTKMLDIDDKDRLKQLQLSYRRQMRSLPRIEIQECLDNPDDLYLSTDSSHGIMEISPSFGIPKSHTPTTPTYEISSSANKSMFHSFTTLPYDSLELSPSFYVPKSHSAASSPCNSTLGFFPMNIRRYSGSGKTIANFSQRVKARRLTFSANSISKRKRFVYSSLDIRKILHNNQSEAETLLLSDLMIKPKVLSDQ